MGDLDLNLNTHLHVFVPSAQAHTYTVHTSHGVQEAEGEYLHHQDFFPLPALLISVSHLVGGTIHLLDGLDFVGTALSIRQENRTD